MADTHHDYTTEGGDDEPSVNTSALVLAVITLAVYILFLRPTAEETPQQRQQQAQRGTQPPQQRQRTPRQPPQPRQTPTTRAEAAAAAQPQRARKVSLSDNAIEILSQCQRLPPHVHVAAASASSSSSTTIGGFHLLNENGLVAFSHTKAASTTTNIQPQHLRKGRAKILSRLLPVGSKPPSKGSTFVLGLSHNQHLQEEEQLEAIRAVISCLSLHYTVLVICHLESAGSSDDYTKNHKNAVQRLQLENNVLPEHRVLLSSTPGGRVALVRQLSSNIGLTVDFDMSVQTDLQRFGFNVTVVDNWKTII